MKSLFHHFADSLRHHRRISRVIGVWHTLLHFVCKVLRFYLTLRLTTPYAAHPLLVRLGTSDVVVFCQIFGEREYSCFDDLIDVTTVIDCGANVGYSSAYFLTRFPKCTIVAVEPDKDNFAQLQANLAPYGARVKPRCSAIWHLKVGLKVSAPTVQDGILSSWGVTVSEVADGEPADMQAVTIPDLIAETQATHISILKIDVEGAEVPIFSRDCLDWLTSVDNIAIELHDAHGENIFAAAIQNTDFVVGRCEELTVCRRIATREAAAVS